MPCNALRKRGGVNVAALARPTERPIMLAAILYARSGVMRAAFNALGWDAIEVDIAPAQHPGEHWQGDVFAFMETDLWRAADVAVLHPVCTYLSGSGLHWNERNHGRAACTLWSLDTVRRLIAKVEASGKPAIMENPVGVIGTHIRPATQSVQPYQFGDDASKRTCLWMLNGCPALDVPPEATWHPGRVVQHNGKLVRRWSNQTDGGQNRLAPSEERAGMRAETYPGIADAIAATLAGAMQPAQLHLFAE